MGKPAFSPPDSEKVIKEASDNHYLRPWSSLVGGLCRASLTDKRLIFCDEKNPGAVLHEIRLDSIESLGSDETLSEPSIEIDLRDSKGAADKIFLYFRDEGWHLGNPRRLNERDEWFKALQVSAGVGKNGKWLNGKYEVLDQIGEGGMGVVLEGIDHNLNRRIAIKKLRPEIRLRSRDKKIFLREAQISASLHHPFIVDIYEIFEKNDDIYLIFEFVDGQTVEQLIDKIGRVSAADTKRVLKCVCDALAFAHSKNFAHRDLKPSNIMVTQQGHAKVMDFGIARQMKDTTATVTKLDTSGTMPYMAPEQELGRFNSKSDLFSLGVTAYEMLTGELPFIGPNFYLQKEKMLFKAILETAPETPKDFAAAVERCLRFDSKDRFENVDEFAQAIGVY